MSTNTTTNLSLAKRLTMIDERASAAVAFGVTGLFFFNIVFGPLAVTLGVLAARRHRTGPTHRAALAGVLLGVADLVVLAVTVTQYGISGI
jgi:hypothetical protein